MSEVQFPPNPDPQQPTKNNFETLKPQPSPFQAKKFTVDADKIDAQPGVDGVDIEGSNAQSGIDTKELNQNPKKKIPKNPRPKYNSQSPSLALKVFGIIMIPVALFLSYLGITDSSEASEKSSIKSKQIKEKSVNGSKANQVKQKENEPDPQNIKPTKEEMVARAKVGIERAIPPVMRKLYKPYRMVSTFNNPKDKKTIDWLYLEKNDGSKYVIRIKANNGQIIQVKSFGNATQITKPDGSIQDQYRVLNTDLGMTMLTPNSNQLFNVVERLKLNVSIGDKYQRTGIYDPLSHYNNKTGVDMKIPKSMLTQYNNNPQINRGGKLVDLNNHRPINVNGTHVPSGTNITIAEQNSKVLKDQDLKEVQ